MCVYALCVYVSVCVSLSVCKCGWGWANGWRGVISNYRVCTTKSPERRREEKRRRREKALPLSALLSTVASGEEKKRGKVSVYTLPCHLSWRKGMTSKGRLKVPICPLRYIFMCKQEIRRLLTSCQSNLIYLKMSVKV